MKLAFELSGEHETIPRSEVLSLFGNNVAYEADRVLIMNVNSYDPEIAERLAMTHSVIAVATICKQDLNAIYNAASGMDFPKATISVRAKRINSHLKSTDVERIIGRALFERGYKINLQHPEMTVRALLTDDVCIIGKLLASLNRSSFEERRPHLRPFFYPGVLLPRAARAAVNLTRVKVDGLLLDPFCGTGGILIEAGLMGIKTVGSDAQSMMVYGTQMNTGYYGLDCALLIQDARKLGLSDESVEAVVTDLPYGRSSRIQAQSYAQLRSEAIAEIYRVLKKGKRAVVISYTPIKNDIEEAGFSIDELHSQYVHKSLTRTIIVAKK
ncbi:MAG TPA: THUMP domain-containing protein [Candidatus Acidoferrales bacterium]|nr:THUMP domain-containing protein [Candidatus Acidoferrales bacterium]